MTKTKLVGSAELRDQVCGGASNETQEKIEKKGGSNLKAPPLTEPQPPSPSLTPKVEPKEDEEVIVKHEQEKQQSVEKEKGDTSAPTVVDEKELDQVEAGNTYLDQNEKLDNNLFPHLPIGDSSFFPLTLPNLEVILRQYGIIVRYNMVKRSAEILMPGLTTSLDNAKNIAMARIKSLARQNGVTVSGIEEAVLALADLNQYNPVANWILSKPWDGTDRLAEFYSTLTTTDGYLEAFKKILMRRWMISAVAAVFEPHGFKSRGVLTLQGKQSIGKTSWFSSLVPDAALRAQVVKVDQRMDAGNKDCIIAAATHWLVELGELEGSFKKSIDRLKGFLTNDIDKVRVPYARTASEFQRRTVFGASVNDDRFLVDSTGNSRWWVIPLEKVNYEHGLDMQQVWAQFADIYKSGEQWWLMPQEEDYLETINRDHRVVSVVEERVMPLLDLSRKNEEGLPAMTASEVLMKVGYKYVSNPQAKECGALLRYHLGTPKKINGYMKWRIPFAEHEDFTKIED
jgi:putative DNA primase/helicase